MSGTKQITIDLNLVNGVSVQVLEERLHGFARKVCSGHDPYVGFFVLPIEHLFEKVTSQSQDKFVTFQFLSLANDLEIRSFVPHLQSIRERRS